MALVGLHIAGLKAGPTADGGVRPSGRQCEVQPRLSA